MEVLRKYATATHVYIPVIKRAVVDFAVGADWTPTAGDVKISIDGGAAANVATLPTAIVMGNGAMWDFPLSSGETTGKKMIVTVVDAATKAVEDQSFLVATYGNASAEYVADLSDGTRLGLTALPNAAAEAAGGLYTRGAGAGQINQDANGRVDTNLKTWIGGTPDALSSGKVPADVKLWLAVAMNALIGGRVDANAQVVGDKTAYALSAAGVQAIWDALTSALTTVGSIGKRLADDVDATVSSRATQAQILSDATPFPGARIDAAISTRAAPGAAMSLVVDAVDSVAVAASGANEIADALLDRASAVEGFTVRQLLRILAAALAGKADGFPTTTVHYRDLADTKNRVTATVDADGNRTAVTLDGT